MNLLDFASNINERENGIFYSNTTSSISYPTDQNYKCAQFEDDSFWFKHRNSIIVEAVKKHNPNAVFFDIGGGNGFVAKGLQDAGIETVLVEPGETGALNAKSRGINTIVCSTLEDAKFHENRIDACGFFDVVEHIEDDKGFLKNANSFLKPNGLVYITVPAFKLLWSNEDKRAGHFRRYTLKSIQKLLKESGFEIVYSTYIFTILPFPIFFMRSIPSRLGMNTNSYDVNKHKKDHKRDEGYLSSLINSIWKWEINQVKAMKKIPFGGSCFIIARKIS